MPGDITADQNKPQQMPAEEPIGIEAVLESVLDAVLILDAEGHVVFANHAVHRVFGHHPADLVGQPVEVLVPTDVREQHELLRTGYVRRPVPRRMGEGVTLSGLRSDGSTFPAEISLALLQTPAGACVTAVVRDASAERARQHNERHLDLSQQVAQMGSWEEDLVTGQVRWSRQLYRMLDLHPGGVPAGMEEFYGYVHPDDRARLEAEVVRTLAHGGQLYAEVRLSRSGPAGDGSPGETGPCRTRTVAVLGCVELDVRGAPVRSVGTVQDITARTRLEGQLRASNDRFRASFDQAPIGMAMIDARSGWPAAILMANAALAELTGIPAGELVGRLIADLTVQPEPSPEPSSDQAACGQPRCGDPDCAHAVEVRLARPDGAERWVSMSSAVVRAADGTPDYYVSHFLDVTEQRQAEAVAKQRGAQDARIAAVLQDSLMPYVPRRVGPVLVASRYRPAGHGAAVGGDWSDVFALPGGRIGLVVGDVAGHGIESAATMSRLRTVVRMVTSSAVSPAGVMRRLNDVMHETDISSDIAMATLVHGQLDPGTGTLVYCSAGHLPMVVLPASREGRARVASPVPSIGGPPIGVVAGITYAEEAIALEPGSRLIGFTDGLIERRDVDLDESLLRLLTTISALPEAVTSNLESLADVLLDLSVPETQDDDVAVIVLGFEPNAPTSRPRLHDTAGRPEPHKRRTGPDTRSIDLNRLRRQTDNDRR